ncbi:UDP-N-acetylglucosamine 2-epimerase [Posidoniimonas polymericola]|uniref:UDP-N-acetylglucosamine 2-epimerase (non-hydrolyzing) n=1 Tax=Posidoniimonas polymericola TaxID=2528002 RepID=A0A5C5YS75_9BACT|nr:UDP-N-acetylglucosamine 2-epimerase (non-hydrolyzing) [Posidoniimonas polymericola]TWT77785.1 UDP-N-acetylglucosamine 2-epimerase [Posidoniimonas polymericola]
MPSSPCKPLLVVGTRPEAIKMAPVVRACLGRDEMTPVVCFTGQHQEMLAQVADYFGLTADVNLDVMRPNQSLSGLTARCLEGLDRVVQEHAPTVVVAQGDTSSVLAAALTAFYHRLPLVHVEAGLRTHNLQAPWPEEFNRRVASIATTVHCAPTERSADELRREHVPNDQIHVTGNTVVDALLATVERERENGAHWRCRHAGLERERLVLITGHRRENFGAGMQGICDAIAALARRFTDTDFVYPVHLNPNVRGPVHEALGGLANVHLLLPASYPEFVWLMDRSTLILTDSGGVQEEAPSLGKPLLVMRDTTERPEAVDAGAARLVGASTGRIVEEVSLLLDDPAELSRRRPTSNPYGDGHAAERIAGLIAGC